MLLLVILSRSQSPLHLVQPKQIRFSQCSSLLSSSRFSFSLSAKEKHFSSTQESLKQLDETIIPYMKKERDMLQVAHDHPALLIADVFSGKMTKPVTDEMDDNYIKLVKIPPNMTHIFQLLDFTFNKATKA